MATSALKLHCFPNSQINVTQLSVVWGQSVPAALCGKQVSSGHRYSYILATSSVVILAPPAGPLSSSQCNAGSSSGVNTARRVSIINYIAALTSESINNIHFFCLIHQCVTVCSE